MMILRSSPPSPFGRKVKIAAKVVGAFDEIEVIAADTSDEKDSVRTQNPLGKIPVLILDDGLELYDSRVICEYIDTLHSGEPLIPAVGRERFEVLRLAALCDGILDASILMVYEQRFRDEGMRDASWVSYQAEKVARALTWLENHVPELTGSPNIAHISLACTLGYRDLRFAGSWREAHPKLVAWLDQFAAAVPAFSETAPET